MNDDPRLIMLNLGCGGNILPPPWRNHDRDMDITQPLPFADSTVDGIFIEHCLEHVTLANGLRFLIEAYRVLKPGAGIRICVPQLANLSNEKAKDIVYNHGHEAVYNGIMFHDFFRIAGFSKWQVVGRADIDGHWKVAGFSKEEDDIETLRVVATK